MSWRGWGTRLSAVALAVSLAASQSSAQRASSPATGKAAAQTSTAAAQVTIRDETFHAPSLARDMKYRVLLPVGYGATQRRWPVLYLLHGALGSYVDWETRTRIVQYFRDVPMIVVMPDADESWYTNSLTVAQDRFEDYIVKDLIAEIEGKFQVIRAPYARAIAGLSMGGYGAMKFALKYPRLFVFAASFSGAFQVPAHVADWPNRLFEKDWARIFGPAETAVHDEADDLYKLAPKVDPATMPFLWFSCGTADRLVELNRDFARALNQRGIAYEYHETPGAHAWDFWDAQLRAFLPVLRQRMKLE